MATTAGSTIPKVGLTVGAAVFLTVGAAVSLVECTRPTMKHTKRMRKALKFFIVVRS
jgi:hypothetical protein